MKKFLFSTADFPGYLDWGGLLQTAICLQEAGHRVLWICGPSTEPLLQKMGIETVHGPAVFNLSAMPEHHRQTDEKRSRQYRVLDYYMDLLMDEGLVRASCEAHMRVLSTYSANAIIADPTVLGAKLSAEACNIPFSGCGYPGGLFVLPDEPEMAPLHEKYQSRLARLRSDLSLPVKAGRPDPDILFSSEDLHLVYTTPDWFQGSESRPSPGVLYVGGICARPQTPPPAWLEELPVDRPLVLIGRSTNYQSFPAAIEFAFEVIKGIDGYGLIGGIAEVRAHFTSLPNYIRWEPWMPYEHVMPIVNTVIHHGGMGTTCLAVRHAIPQVIVPEVIDNHIHAQAIENNGAGLTVLPEDLTKTGVIHTLRRVLEESSFRAAAENLRDRFANLGGAPRAAERLLQFAT